MPDVRFAPWGAGTGHRSGYVPRTGRPVGSFQHRHLDSGSGPVRIRTNGWRSTEGRVTPPPHRRHSDSGRSPGLAPLQGHPWTNLGRSRHPSLREACPPVIEPTRSHGSDLALHEPGDQSCTARSGVSFVETTDAGCLPRRHDPSSSKGPQGVSEEDQPRDGSVSGSGRSRRPFAHDPTPPPLARTAPGCEDNCSRTVLGSRQDAFGYGWVVARTRCLLHLGNEGPKGSWYSPRHVKTQPPSPPTQSPRRWWMIR